MQATAKKFNFKEMDAEGHETLEVISSADNFNRWMYATIQPFCKGKILEAGSGTGNISQFFLRDGSEIMLSDIRKNYCSILAEKFEQNKNLLGVKNIDLVFPEFDSCYQPLFGIFDTVYALNVVEHIEKDTLAIANAKKFLKSGGTLIVLVPAYQWLYNRFDSELCHFKRYTKQSLSDLFLQNELVVSNTFYFNALGVLGWFVSGRIFKNKIIHRSQLSFYNSIVSLAKAIDIILLKQFGLSVVVVGTKK